MAEDSKDIVARVILQQCLSAKLQVKPPSQSSEGDWVEGNILNASSYVGAREGSLLRSDSSAANQETANSSRTAARQLSLSSLSLLVSTPVFSDHYANIKRGMVIYVCFFKGADNSVIPRMVSALLNVKLSETDDGKHVSIQELPGDILIVPQATLGGKMKGRCMQYHSNAGKDQAMQLYSQFTTQCQQELDAHPKWAEAGSQLRFGTYGNRQVLQLDTNGPYTHLLEF